MDRIKGLDGIRAFAVMAVIISHLGVYPALKEFGLWKDAFLPVFSGLAGVHIFFVLSGFLITHLLILEGKKNGVISLKSFYYRRSLRILPLYFLIVSLIVLMECVGNARTQPVSYLYALTFTFNMMPKEHYSAILGHTWSLAVEEHFYLVWPFVFSAFFFSRRAVLYVVCVSVVVASVWLQHAIEPLQSRFFVERWTLPAGSSIAIGVFAALAMNHKKESSKLRCFGGALSLCTAFFLYFHSFIFKDIPWGAGVQIRAAGVALFLVWVYLNQESIIVRVLEIKPLVYVGVISYGLYMWQGFFLSTGPGRGASQTWPPDSLTGLVLLCLVAPLSYHAFEKPFLKLKNKFSSR